MRIYKSHTMMSTFVLGLKKSFLGDLLSARLKLKYCIQSLNQEVLILIQEREPDFIGKKPIQQIVIFICFQHVIDFQVLTRLLTISVDILKQILTANMPNHCLILYHPLAWMCFTPIDVFRVKSAIMLVYLYTMIKMLWFLQIVFITFKS